MKLLFLIIISQMLISLTFAQDYYYSDNRKLNLTKSNNWIVVQISEQDKNIFKGAITDISAAHVKQNLKPERGIYWLEIFEGNDILNTLNQIQKRVRIIRTIPAYLMANEAGDTARFIMSDEFHVKFHPHVTRTEIDTVNAQYGVEILNYNEYDEYILRVKEDSPYNTLELANLYYESDLTVWSLPNFMADIRHYQINDPLFPNQWHLRNKGQGGGSHAIDNGALAAWDITTGSSNIIVAVIDDGVESHEDFGSTQRVPGYSGTGGDGSPGTESKHGQTVAGIVSANHNDTGVRGVASNVKLMSINIFDGSSNSQVARAIDTAWTRGAHILNNSWGYPYCPPIWLDNVEAAITRALTNGRNGKGCLVVFAAGNTGSCVTFPATVPGVIAVGAITNTNNPASYTPRDLRVDVVAPSNHSLWGGTCNYTDGNIWTTDRHPGGYTPCGGQYFGDSEGKYFSKFGGTSAAAPQVSGIGALILSVNPNLDARAAGTNPNPQVQNIIKQTAYDYGATNWDGHGRVSAIKAVANAYVLANPQYTFTTGTAPMSLQQSNFWVSFTAPPRSDIAAGTYYCDRYIVDVTLSGYAQILNSWYLPPPGFSFANPNNASEWLEKTTTSSSVRFRTVFYYIKYNVAGQTINKWAPFDPNQNYLREYAVIGTPLVAPVISGFTQTPSPIYQGGSGTVRCNLSQGNGNLNYTWQAYDFPTGASVEFDENTAFINYSFIKSLGEKAPAPYLYCTVLNDAGSYTYSTIVYFDQSGGGCPFVYTWNGDEYIEDNNILPQSEYNKEEDLVTDYYQLFTEPALTEGTYRMRVGEFEQEQSVLDNFSLIVVDHIPEAMISVDGTGEISLYVKPAALANAQHANNDVLKQLYYLDENYVEVANGDTLQLTFEDQQVAADKAILLVGIIPEPPVKKYFAGNVVQNEEGKETNNQAFRMRRNPSYIWIPVTNHNSKENRIDILWHQKAKLDFSELGNKLDIEYNVYNADLISGMHSIYGDVSELLNNADNNVTTLNPGEWVDLEFSAPPVNEGMQRSFVFVSRGRYEKIEGKSIENSSLISKQLINKSSINENIPNNYELYQNNPNPFNPVTITNYQLPIDNWVTLKVYDILGREVATLVDGWKEAGRYEIEWDGSGQSSGVYLYKLSAGEFVAVKKMLLAK